MKKTLMVLILTLLAVSLFISCNNNTEVVTYKVTVMNGENVYREKDVADGDIYVLPSKPSEDTRPFRGWKIGESTDLMQPGEDLKITGNTEITAVWVTSCTVSFDLCDDSLTKLADMTVDYGSVNDAPAVPSRTGYVFSNWKIKNGGIFDFRNPVTQDLELEAVWTEIKTNLTLYFPENVNDVETIKVDVGGSVVTVPYSEGEEDGEYRRYTVAVTGLDYGTYTATVSTLKGNSAVGGSFSDTVKISYVESDKEIKVDTSNVIDITTSVVTKASSVSGDAADGYVISGTATLSYGDGVTVLYSIDGSEPAAYASGTSLDVTSSTSLALTVSSTDSSKWTTGTVSNEIRFGSLIGTTGPGGGIIFYDAGSVKYYPDKNNAQYSYRFLEAATSDVGSYPFSSTADTYSTSVAIGSGRANTELLKGISGSAAEACSKYTQGGKTDWFLPSRNELRSLLEKSQIIPGLSSDFYWSSSIDLSDTESTYESAYVNKTTDYTSSILANRSVSHSVRAIRCF